MAKTRTQKQSVIAELKRLLTSAKGMALMTFSKIAVKADWELRRAAKQQGVEYRVAKKTLLDRAAKEMGVRIDALGLSRGTVGFAVSMHDEVAPAKLFREFMKRQKEAVVAFLGGAVRAESSLELLTAAQVQTLASMPGKQEQLRMLVRTVQNPLSRFVGAISYPMRSLVQVMSAIQKTKTS